MLVLNNTAEASDAETASEMATVGSPRPMRGLGVTWFHTPSDYRRKKETMEAEPAYIKKERSNDVWRLKEGKKKALVHLTYEQQVHNDFNTSYTALYTYNDFISWLYV